MGVKGEDGIQGIQGTMENRLSGCLQEQNRPEWQGDHPLFGHTQSVSCSLRGWSAPF